MFVREHYVNFGQRNSHLLVSRMYAQGGIKYAVTSLSACLSVCLSGRRDSSSALDPDLAARAHNQCPLSTSIQSTKPLTASPVSP